VEQQNMNRKRSTWLIFFGLILVPPHLVADDLSAEIRKGASSPDYRDGLHIELGVLLSINKSAVVGVPVGNKKDQVNLEPNISLNLKWQKHGWFIEGSDESLMSSNTNGGIGGLALGYHLVNTDSCSLDIIGSPEHDEVSEDASKDFKNLHIRRSDFMAGARTTLYSDNYIFQFHLLTDVSHVHNGQTFSARAGRAWQYRNWNYHAIIGADYQTEHVTSYYLSAKPGDITAQTPNFQANAGFSEVIEVGVTYPISEKWVFRSLFRHVQLDNQWRDSPLLVGNRTDAFQTSINYVF
jgi:MipA family protein